MMEYKTIELNRRVAGVQPDMLTRFKRRANRRCKYLNKNRLNTGYGFFYRYEVCDWLDGRWAVVAMQNELEPVRNG